MPNNPCIRVVLVNPSHPGNIGATARAMKLMGLSDLVLVGPKRFPDSAATARATGAADLLEKARVVSSLSEALSDCVTVYAATARGRSLAIPTASAREWAAEMAETPNEQIALVFGRECSGLTNEELSLAHRAICIPTSAEFSSLNLAQAVQIVCYECFVARQATQPATTQETRVEKGGERASMEQMAGLYSHLETTLEAIEFLKPAQSATLMQRLMRLYNRAELSVNELNILRGILSDTDRQVTLRQETVHE
jgi:tRNA (cytidine32/uridine32-2'-O)-methyltransferase